MEESLIRSIESDEMQSSRIAAGAPGAGSHPELLRPALAEFISMVIFVFAGEGLAVALCKLDESNVGSPAGLVATALACGFGFFVAVSAAASISGGHVNPAVTLGAYVGGNINLIRLLYYWAAQLLGSVVACFLLAISTGGMKTAAPFSLSPEISIGGALLMEIVMTYGLVHTFYATTIEPNKGNIGVIAPLALGFIVAANTLAGGAFDGASLNPAVSFGPALLSWTWTHQWVYWIGPLIGGGAAGLIYDNFLQGDPPNEPLPLAN